MALSRNDQCGRHQQQHKRSSTQQRRCENYTVDPSRAQSNEDTVSGWGDLNEHGGRSQTEHLQFLHRNTANSPDLVTEIPDDRLPHRIAMMAPRTPPVYYVRETKSGRMYAPKCHVDYPLPDPKQSRKDKAGQQCSSMGHPLVRQVSDDHSKCPLQSETRPSSCSVKNVNKNAKSRSDNGCYRGAQTASVTMAELAPTDFALYHRLSSDPDDDEPPLELQLTIAYRTSRGDERHYPVVSVNEQDIDHHERVMCKVQCGDRKAPLFSNVSSLIDYYRHYGHVEMLPFDGKATVDVFPWWRDGEDFYHYPQSASEDHIYEEFSVGTLSGD